MTLGDLETLKKTQAVIDAITALSVATRDDPKDEPKDNRPIPPVTWDIGKIRVARNTLVALKTELQGAADNLRTWSRSVVEESTDVSKKLKALAKLTGEPAAAPHERKWKVFRTDVYRCLPGGLAALLAVATAGNVAVGWLLIVLVDIWIALILAIAAVRSDSDYKTEGVRVGRIGRWNILYERVIPSKALAIFVVISLFLALWLGFASVYQGYENPHSARCGARVLGPGQTEEVRWYAPPCRQGEEPKEPGLFTSREARSLSFLTLAAFDGPGDDFPDPLRGVVLLELGHAIFLVLGIFALLINRLSEWD